MSDPKTDRRIARLAELDPRPELLSLDVEGMTQALGAWLGARGAPRYRVEQVLAAIYQRHVSDWDAMTTLSKALRAELAQSFRFPSLELEEERVSADGTHKLLWK